MIREEYLALLAQCRVGLSLAPEGVEAHFAHRTRVLDYLTAGLPCVLSGGDSLAEEAEREGWGRAIPAGNLRATAKAVRELSEDGPRREIALQAVRRARKERLWKHCVRSLEDYLELPSSGFQVPSWPWSALEHQLTRWLT
jgi:glycosyltransferase involved in cell wall biosynthesis